MSWAVRGAICATAVHETRLRGPGSSLSHGMNERVPSRNDTVEMRSTSSAGPGVAAAATAVRSVPHNT